MFYYLSKISQFFLMPSNIIAAMMFVGAVMIAYGRVTPLARRLLGGGAALLLLCGVLPLGNWLVLPLEQRFERGRLPEHAVGILILGGFETARVTQGRGNFNTNEAGERLTEALLLARRLPKSRVIFTGGVGGLRGGDLDTAGPVGRYLREVGIDSDRIVLEGQSRTTYENAVFTRVLLEPLPGEKYMLVTSAYHMPRAVGVFRAQGFDVIPWPVDFRTAGPGDWLSLFATIPEGLERVDLAIKEWIGLIAYRVSGRSTAFWPAPDAPVTAPPRPSPGSG